MLVSNYIIPLQLGTEPSPAGCFVRGALPGDSVQCLGYESWHWTIWGGIACSYPRLSPHAHMLTPRLSPDFIERIVREVRHPPLALAHWRSGSSRLISKSPTGSRPTFNQDRRRPHAPVRSDGDPLREAVVQVQGRPVAVPLRPRSQPVPMASIYDLVRSRRPVCERAHPSGRRLYSVSFSGFGCEELEARGLMGSTGRWETALDARRGWQRK